MVKEQTFGPTKTIRKYSRVTYPLFLHGIIVYPSTVHTAVDIHLCVLCASMLFVRKLNLWVWIVLQFVTQGEIKISLFPLVVTCLHWNLRLFVRSCPCNRIVWINKAGMYLCFYLVMFAPSSKLSSRMFLLWPPSQNTQHLHEKHSTRELLCLLLYTQMSVSLIICFSPSHCSVPTRNRYDFELENDVGFVLVNFVPRFWSYPRSRRKQKEHGFFQRW